MRSALSPRTGRCLARALLASFLSLGMGTPAFGQGKYINISLQGGYQRSHGESTKTTRTSLGAEMGVPLTDFFEISAGQTILLDKSVYTDEYRESIYAKYGWSDLPETLVTQDEIYDTSINGAIGYPIGFLKPTLFGGKLWRKVCSETILADEGCSSTKNSWNAGVALSVFMTQSLRLKLSYRISPSARSDDKKTYDDSTSVGLTWGY